MQAISRLELLSRWVYEDLGFAGSQIAPASADASFRRYFRLTRGTDTYIIMDAPPDKEDSKPLCACRPAIGGSRPECAFDPGAGLGSWPVAVV